MRFFPILTPIPLLLILLCNSTLALAAPAANPIGAPSGNPTDTPSWMPTAEPTTDPSPVPSPVCGNRITERYEECDDGNRVSGDDCDADCRREPCGVHPLSEFDDARTTIATNWIGDPAGVTGPENWFRTPEGGKWVWWPRYDQDLLGDDGTTASKHAYAVVMQDWHCVKDSWIKVADTAMGYAFGNGKTAAGVTPSNEASGSSILNYQLKYVSSLRDSRKGSIEDTTYTKDCQTDGGFAVGAPLFVLLEARKTCSSIHKKLTSSWAGNPDAFSMEETKSNESTTVDEKVTSRNGVTEVVHREYEKIGIGTYEFGLETRELDRHYLAYSAPFHVVLEILDHESEFKVEGYRSQKDTSQEWGYRSNGKVMSYKFDFKFTEPGNSFSGDSELEFHENPVVLAGSPAGTEPHLILSNLKAKTTGYEAVEFSWDPNGNLTTPLNDPLLERFELIKSTLTSWGGTSYWITPLSPPAP